MKGDRGMKRRKQLVATGIIVTLYLLLYVNQVYAAGLQANGNEPASKDQGAWLAEVRQMQGAGGALGLIDTINYDATNYDATKPETCDLKSNNSNLDIHMEKNTEYGALAILSASSYGNPNPIADGETTTGNKTGVVMKLNSEWTASGLTNSGSGAFLNASKRYKDVYSSETSGRTGSNNRTIWIGYKEMLGDAVAEGEMSFAAWHTPGSATWFIYADTEPSGGVVRATDGNIFSYYAQSTWNRTGNAWIDSYAAAVWQGHPTRAVVVVGSGI